ncbi:MAG: aspartate carbamoyltransferase catalytic subunit [Actinomycetia bacterium]|nr:aspartate carbamoyltransferase catalytic subunit [Actinomycetes bacterium]MCP4958902.1 aspartate carbamoyltransferase catalytic subunit [Actinomycetes bacterium]
MSADFGRHLLALNEIGVDGIKEILSMTDRFVEINERPIPKVPALRGKTVCTMFFEDSTRTKLSFEAAAKRLSADTMSMSVSSSSVKKGESVRDTIETIQAMGIDAFVVRHKSSGVPWQIANWVDDHVSILNGGDGWHSHPTQGLLDSYTLCQARDGEAGENPSLDGVHVGLIGDIKHSRVARSDVEAFTALGAKVTLIGPPTLMPPSVVGWSMDGSTVDISHDLDSLLPELDVVALLRIQRERMGQALIPSIGEYVETFGLNRNRMSLVRPDAIITHPGPMNRGVEVSVDVLDGHPGTVVLRQVTNGVAVRMAVLFLLLGSGVVS